MSLKLKWLVPASILLLAVVVIAATGSSVGWSKAAFVPMSPWIAAIFGCCYVSFLWVLREAE